MGKMCMQFEILRWDHADAVSVVAVLVAR